MKISRTNSQLKQQLTSTKQTRYAIKKLSCGAVSVAVVSLLYFGQNAATVFAEESPTSVTTDAPATTEAAAPTATNDTAVSAPATKTATTENTALSSEQVPTADVTVADTTSAQPPVETPAEVSTATEKQIQPVVALPEAPQPVATTNTTIPEHHFRMHFAQLPSQPLQDLGLWVWGNGVTSPSSNWPTGALRFSESNKTEYGYYVDVPVQPNATSIQYLINRLSNGGENLTGDKTLEIKHSQMKQAWLDAQFRASEVEPLPQNERRLRVHYTRADGQYDHWGLWVWGDVEAPSTDWPNGALDFIQQGPFGRYIDVPLNTLGKNIQFLLVNKVTRQQTRDMSFTDRAHFDQIYLRDEEAMVYTSPFKTANERLIRVEITTPHTLDLSFTTVDKLDLATIKDQLMVTNQLNQPLTIDTVTAHPNEKKLTLAFATDISRDSLRITYGEDTVTAQVTWKLKDALYQYNGELGATLHQDGSATLRLWSPSADAVSAILYDKQNPEQRLATIALAKQGNSGVWAVELTQQNTNLRDLNGYFYHYLIERGGQSVIALDPYAKSLAKWDQSIAKEKVAKAAIIDPSRIGPTLEFAKIPGYTKREDAIIYEAHVRDFTSDPAIASELKHQFGTFAAFAERLAYLKKLGVTHIQLMPIMSYFYAEESQNGIRELTPSTQNNRYNWGYDPQGYFALSGMYTSNPNDPAKRIEEFKSLVQAIHAQGMGVILDVVFNHTAKTYLFEDLEPNYYHFMNLDGTPRESFGGGRLGTTHYMSRRLLVDAIQYWTQQFKVDGFRFDMMGDHDAAAIQLAYDTAKQANPHLLMLGEGWRTFVGDEGEPAIPHADQDWMKHTDSVGVFSDEIRNLLKSGYPSEGEPRFLTGAKQNLHRLFNNIIANPSNFIANAPGDVIQYIAAHDNLTLHDIIAQSIKKDPKEAAQEIHQRIRLGNLLILTSQGTPFLHSGQEMGRTKQLVDPQFRGPVAPDKAPYKTHYLTKADGTPFEYPYFVHDSYDSSDSINRFDWTKALNQAQYPIHNATREYTTGLIALRRATDAFRQGSAKEIADRVELIVSNNSADEDLVIGYQAKDSNGDIYAVFVNADTTQRTLNFSDYFPHLKDAEVIVDGRQAGITAITNPFGVTLSQTDVTLAPLTATILRLKKTIPAETVTPIPQVSSAALTINRGESPTLAQYQALLQQLPQDAHVSLVEDLTPDGPTTQQVKLKVTFADGSTRIVPISVTIKEVAGPVQRTFTDAASGIRVVLSEQETAAVTDFVVRLISPATHPALKHLNAMVYDFTLLDKQQQVVQVTQPLQISVPLLANQSFDHILYLVNGTLVETVPHKINGTFVDFTVPHFSQYAFIYTTQVQPTPPVKPQVEEELNEQSVPQPPIVAPIVPNTPDTTPQVQLITPQAMAHATQPHAQPITPQPTKTALPHTGETLNNELLVAILASLLGGAYLVKRKQQED